LRPLPARLTELMVLTPAGNILLAGRVSTGKREDGFDTFLAFATPAGLVRTHLINGAGDQDLEALAVSPDDLALLQVSNHSVGEDEPDPALYFDRREFLTETEAITPPRL
jgi:hypothetical protein